MKILLAACNAKYIHSNLAVYNLKSCSGEYSSRVVVKEYTINQIRDDILKDIYLEQPDVVCFSCYIWNLEFVQDIAADLYKVLPDLLHWWHMQMPHVILLLPKTTSVIPQYTLSLFLTFSFSTLLRTS